MVLNYKHGVPSRIWNHLIWADLADNDDDNFQKLLCNVERIGQGGLERHRRSGLILGLQWTANQALYMSNLLLLYFVARLNHTVQAPRYFKRHISLHRANFQSLFPLLQLIATQGFPISVAGPGSGLGDLLLLT